MLYNRCIASHQARNAAWQTYRRFPNKSAIKDRTVRIAFFLESPESWDSLASVWNALRNDSRCDTTVVCLNNYPRQPLDPASRLLDENVPFVRQDFYSLDFHKPDVALFHKQYDNNKHRHFRSVAVLKKVPRTVFISYGFPIGGGSLRTISQYNYPLQQFAWRVYVHSNAFKNMFGRYCLAGNHHVRVVGHPMVDALLEMNAGKVDSGLVQACGKRKVVLWNPHYCETSAHDDCSTFFKWKDLMLDEFCKRKNMMLIVRPHPLLFTHLTNQRLMTQREISAFTGRIEKSSNMLLDQRADYRHSFFVSHAMMSDISSFLTLYPVTGKPVLYLHNVNGPGLNENGGIVKGFYRGETADNVVAFLDMVEKGQDPLRECRGITARDYLFMPEKGAGHAIAEDMFRSIADGR